MVPRTNPSLGKRWKRRAKRTEQSAKLRAAKRRKSMGLVRSRGSAVPKGWHRFKIANPSRRRPSRAHYPHASKSLRDKREKCVREIKRRPGKKPYNPWAVCTASIERKTGRHMDFTKPRSNPAKRAGKKKVPSQIPEAEIRWIVGNFHVGKSDAVIAEDIMRRTKSWPEPMREKAVAYALKVHADNQKLYHGVMTGRFNPSKRSKRRSNPVRGLRYEVWVHRGGKVAPVYATDVRGDAIARAHHFLTHDQSAYVQDASSGRVLGAEMGGFRGRTLRGVRANPPVYNTDSLYERAAEKLGWSVRDARSFSLPMLREIVKEKSPKLAHEIDMAIAAGSHIYEKPVRRRSRR